jgi:hypothetical protein
VCCIKIEQNNVKDVGKAEMNNNRRFSTAKVLMMTLGVFLIPITSQATLVPAQIQQGDSFRFGIDLSSATPTGPYSYISWNVNTSYTDGIDSGEVLSVALYDDADPATALSSGTYNWTGDFTTLSVGAMMAANPAFDGTGFLQFTMVSGSMDLLGGAVFGINNGYTSNGLTDITVLPATTVSVPEPNTLSLVGLALLLCAVTVKLKNRARKMEPAELPAAELLT